MGLDISLFTDNFEEISELEAFEAIEEQCNLSREFCNLMTRRSVIESGIPELDQIANFTGCDINFLYSMENYTSEWELEEIEEYEDEETIEAMKKTNAEIENNIDYVIAKMKALISALNKLENFENRFNKTDFDTIGINEYFADFNLDKGDGYIGNNFGRDLRNILRFAEYAKAHSSKTIFFQYG